MAEPAPPSPPPPETTPAPEAFSPLVPISWFLGIEMVNKLRDIAINHLISDFNARDWMDPGLPVDLRTDRDEIWFDYIADMGDGGAPMAALAFHMQRKALPLQELDPARAATAENGLQPELPAGEFLFLGGDLAYPASDTDTLEARVVRPFRVAQQRLGRKESDGRRSVYGIPGNHDYFDHLHGFNYIVRKHHPPGPKTQLPGYRAAQSASYVRMWLPHAWELWGMDLGKDGLDHRQARYFAIGKDAHDAPVLRRLILCTPAPAIVFGTAIPEPEHHRALHTKLGLRADFAALAEGKPQDTSGHRRKRYDLECRLDLAGDVHHYARYGSVEAVHDAVPAHSFASVVSGGGGAFLHPTSTSVGEIAPRRLYPPPWESRARVGERLVSLRRMLRAGQAWGLAALLAIGIYRGVFVADSAGAAAGFQWLLHVLFGGRTPPPVSSPAYTLAAAGSLGAIGVAMLILMWVRKLILDRSSVKEAKKLRDAEAEHGEPVHSPHLAEVRPPAAAGRQPREPHWTRSGLTRSYLRGLIWITLQLFVIALVLGLASLLWGPTVTLGGALAILAALLWIGGAIALAMVGSVYCRGGARAWLIALGAVEGIMQATLPLAIMLYATGPGLAMTVAVWVASWMIVRELERRRAVRARAHERSAPGAATQAIYTSRATDVAITLLWLARYGLTLFWLVRFSADQEPLFVGWSAVTAVVCGLVGIVVCAQELGWYFLVAMLWQGHNNEAGASVRLEDYKQWIRVHIGKDGVLTGYVIGIDLTQDPFDCKPRLVDVFQVRPKPARPANPG
jgi:hypothetical protein